MLSNSAIGKIIVFTAAGAGHHATAQLDTVMLLGFLAAFMVMVCYLTPHQSKGAMIVLAASLAATALYGFLQGAWPLGIIQTAWSGAVLRESFSPKKKRKTNRQFHPQTIEAMGESRLSRLFGSSN